MVAIAAIVEGHGEVRALPVLLRRLAEQRGVFDLHLPEPIRVSRDRFLRNEGEFRRMLLLAGAKAGRGGRIIILLDADDDCPVSLASQVSARASLLVPNNPVFVIIANREFEAWLLAGAASLAGRRGLDTGLVAPEDPDKVRDVKGWLSQRMGVSRYREVSDQAALCASVDLDAATASSRSFRKFRKDVIDALEPARTP